MRKSNNLGSSKLVKTYLEIIEALQFILLQEFNICNKNLYIIGFNQRIPNIFKLNFEMGEVQFIFLAFFCKIQNHSESLRSLNFKLL
ncbi:hypothetical protein BRADI_1g44973v3 [Brachypodium distachyon]|uniref:Uncharacterized protein n=1 Tax=Brachypodium distachyon TaxID=15368 RepID=A0A0Q3H752_BRADI|nr:hypothetical protein BRADI_1g44973v3 [Brachypodium distachyon]